MQARESLGSLSELFTPMLGEEAAAIGAHAPDASPEDKLADDIKKVVAEESALASLHLSRSGAPADHAAPAEARPQSSAGQTIVAYGTHSVAQ